MANIKGMQQPGNMPVLTYFKSIFKAMVITLIIFGIIAVIATFTKLSENVLSITSSVFMILSIAYSGLLTAMRREKNGFLHGLITGLVYVILIIFLCWVLVKDFSIDKYIIIKAILGIISGGIGGMIGVNLK